MDSPLRDAHRGWVYGKRCVIGIRWCLTHGRLCARAGTASHATRGPLERLSASTTADVPPTVRAAWRRSVGVIRRSPVAGYLQGLTAARVGLVLLICTILTVRQKSLPGVEPTAEFADFLARQFLFALPMLFAVTV